MALTATATKSLRREVCHILGMNDPYLVTVSPDKSNVVFTVSPFEYLETTFKPIMDELKKEREKMERTIIYCQKQETCARLYLLFRLHLASEFTEPIGYPDLPQFRLVDMYTSCTHSKNKSVHLFLSHRFYVFLLLQWHGCQPTRCTQDLSLWTPE